MGMEIFFLRRINMRYLLRKNQTLNTISVSLSPTVKNMRQCFHSSEQLCSSVYQTPFYSGNTFPGLHKTGIRSMKEGISIKNSKVKVCQHFHTSKNTNIGKGEDLLDGQGKVVIVGFSDIGFDTSRGSFQQSIITTTDNAYAWKVEKVEDITLDSIAIFRNLKPRPELVLFGLGNDLKKDLAEEVVENLTKEGIFIEKLDTPNACSTFNILSAEGRNVCAALIPITNES